MRIALISDIHGNEVALRAVISDIERTGVDRIACLGDVATLGPRPQEVLDLVRRKCDLLILGNHDEYMFEPAAIDAHTQAPPVVAAVQQCRDVLDANDIAFIRSFSGRAEVALGAAGGLLLFHGSPESNDCDLLAETPDTTLARLLEPHAATVMAGGHTHIQMVRQHRGSWLVNPGSVGLPFERYVAGGPPSIMAHAEYALVEARGAHVSVTLHRVALDRQALARQVRDWDNPLAAQLSRAYG